MWIYLVMSRGCLSTSIDNRLFEISGCENHDNPRQPGMHCILICCHEYSCISYVIRDHSDTYSLLDLGIVLFALTFCHLFPSLPHSLLLRLVVKYLINID